MGYETQRRILIVAASRSGSYFLCHALDSHTMIGCHRHGILKPDINPDYALYDNDVDRLNAALNRPGYQVAVCKITHREARNLHLATLQLPLDGIIYLYRKDTLRTVASAMINTALQGERQSHTFKALPPVQIELDPVEFLHECERYEGNIKTLRAELMAGNTPVKVITYENMVGDEGYSLKRMLEGTARQLCTWLDIPFEPLRVNLVRTNPQPLSEIITNWSALKAVLMETRFSTFVKSASIK